MTEQDTRTTEHDDAAAGPAATAEGQDGATKLVQDGTDAADDAQAAAVEDDGRPREELVAALATAERERAEFLEALQRSQAEFDNFRKRSMREGASQREAGVAELTGKLLDVLDDFDMALLSVDKTSDVEALHKGLELVYSKLISTLRGVGLERIDDEGAAFDPERHEAVQQVAAEEPVEQPVVADVLRAGYAMKGRVLRAAMVKVAQ